MAASPTPPDDRVAEDKPVTPAYLFAVLLWEPVRERAEARLQEGGLVAQEEQPPPDARSAAVEVQDLKVHFPVKTSFLSRDKPVIGPEHLTFGSATQRNYAAVTMSFDHNPTLAELESEYLALQLKKFSGRRAEVANTLGISERSIYRMIKRFGLENE